MRGQQGLSLLEVLLAVALFAAGTVPALLLLDRSQAGAADGENVWLATHLAQSRLEELRNVAYGSVASEAEARIASPSGFSRFCRDVAVSTPYTNLRQITVTVSWDPPDCLTSNSSPHVSLVAYRSNI